MDKILSDQTSDALLNRAYTLGTEEDSKALYRDWATTYDQSMLDELGYLTPSKTAELLASHLIDKKAVILDAGAGTGLAGVELVHHGFVSLHALDYSAEMLAVAGKRGIYQSLIEADLNINLPLKDNIYDAVICTGTFTHAHVGAECLDELCRVLKPGGLFACTVHKDVWEPAGFENKVPQLHASGTITTLHQQAGTYFANSEEDEGWFIVWQKTG